MHVTATPGAIATIDVPLIEWPAAEPLRARLAAEGRPRLLVVAPTSAPPICLDELEDWVRDPVDMMDVVARTTALRHRAERQARRPLLDDHGLLWLYGRWVSIPPAQVPLVRLLIAQMGHIVPPLELRDAYAASGGSVDAIAFKAAMSRLARRLSGVGLRLHNVGGRGSILEVVDVAG